jgi:hypothetical protein
LDEDLDAGLCFFEEFAFFGEHGSLEGVIEVGGGFGCVARGLEDESIITSDRGLLQMLRVPVFR